MLYESEIDKQEQLCLWCLRKHTEEKTQEEQYFIDGGNMDRNGQDY